MFRDLFKNKAALLIMGGALMLIIALALVFVFLGGGTALAGGGRSGGTGSVVAFAPSAQATPEPENTPEPTADPTPEPTPEPEQTLTPPTPNATPEPSEGDLYVSEPMGFSILLGEGMTVSETAQYSVQFMLGGVNVGGVILSDATTQELMEQAREEFVEWAVETAGADDCGEVIQEDFELNTYPAVLLSVELLVDGELAYQLFNFFVDAPAGGCYVLSYLSLMPFNDAEAELVANALSTFTMLDDGGTPQAAPPLEGYDTYVNEALGFSVQFPDGYTIETGLEENCVDFNWDRNADVGIDVKLYEDATAGDIHAATLSFEHYSEFDIELIEQGTITRGQYEYVSLRYEFAIEDDFVYERNIVIAGENAYAISWITPDYAAIEMPADADVFLESFRVLGY